MSGFDGRAFLLGIQHLDAASRELFGTPGRRTFPGSACNDGCLNEATVRLFGGEHHLDPHGIERTR